jgi:hypothetical protein
MERNRQPAHTSDYSEDDQRIKSGRKPDAGQEPRASPSALYHHGRD